MLKKSSTRMFIGLTQKQNFMSANQCVHVVSQIADWHLRALRNFAESFAQVERRTMICLSLRSTSDALRDSVCKISLREVLWC